MLVLVGGWMVTSRIVLPRAGARLLSHWQEAGLPGSAPQGTGPSFRVGLPPSLSWSNVRWSPEDSIQVDCGTLDVSVGLARLLRGQLRITRISAEDVVVDVGSAAGMWSRSIIEGLADTLGPVEPSRAGMRAIGFDLRGIELRGSDLRVARVAGRAWIPRHASWESAARLELPDGRGVDITARGAGSAGVAELDVGLSSGPLHSVRVSARHAPRSPWTWRGSAQDDGRLLLAMPLLDRWRPRLSFHGEIDLWLERLIDRTLDGEAHIRSGRLAIGDGAGWNLDGAICIGGDTLSFEEFVVHHDDTRVSGNLAIPVTGKDGVGWIELDGVLAARPVHVRGAVRRTGTRWNLSAPVARWGDVETGPLELLFNTATAASEERLRGEVLLGNGRISILGGAASVDDPLRFRLNGVPVEALQSSLPVSLPGRWSGALRGDVSVWRDASGWVATGGSTLSNGRVANLPMLAELAAMSGSSARSTLRIDSARARWSWELRRLWADSLSVVSRELRVDGRLGQVTSDSVLGVLRVQAPEEGTVGKLLRLIGGRGGLDIGVAGDPLNPTLVPLDAESRRRWISRMESARPTMGSPSRRAS